MFALVVSTTFVHLDYKNTREIKIYNNKDTSRERPQSEHPVVSTINSSKTTNMADFPDHFTFQNRHL